MKKICLAIITGLLTVPYASQAQWLTNGNNIYNSNSGNVGINTTTPSEKLEVNYGNIRINHNDPGNRLMWYRTDGTQVTGLGSDGFSIMKFITNGAERMTLSGGGYLGIGHTSPFAKLVVGGAETLADGLNATIGLVNTASGGGTWTLRAGATGTNTPVGGFSIGNATGYRFVINSTGDVGIGTNNLTNGKLQINGSGDLLSLYSNAGVAQLNAYNNSDFRIVQRNNAPMTLWTNTTERFRIGADGNIGIGTNDPKAKLHNTGTFITGGNTANIDPVIINPTFLANSGQMMMGWNRSAGGGETDFIANQGQGGTGGFAFYNYPNTGTVTQLMWIQGNGNVGIGTSTPDQKLSVNGTIHTKKVLVDLIGWSDYVFKPDYKLPNLKDVQNYISQNQHLPGIPSEKELEKTGIDVTEMVKLQMKKIEELTLYLIEKEQQIKEQNGKIQEQNNRLKKLEDLILQKGKDK